MLTVIRKHTLEALLRIERGGPFDKYIGICGNVTQHFVNIGLEWDEDDLDMVIDTLFASWPEKSCSTAYPVGSWSMTPSKLFWEFHDKRRDMWDITTRYGSARVDLLNHMIKEMNQ